VTARDLGDLRAETLPCDPALEVQREEPVVLPGQYPGGHIRPALDGTRLAEGDVGLGKVVRFPRGHDVRGHVVQEVGGQVELGGIPARLRGRDTSRFPAGVAPPVARGFTGQRDHRVDQDQQADRSARARYRRGEAAHRLRGHHDVVVMAADGGDDRIGVFRQPGRLVSSGQVHRDRLVAASAEFRNDPMPVPRRAARAGNEDEHAHEASVLWCHRL
jgi:hypothetical protein